MRHDDTSGSRTKRADQRQEIAGVRPLTAFAGLAAVVVAAVSCAAFAAVPWLRVPAGLLLVLILPGYVLTALIVPTETRRGWASRQRGSLRQPCRPEGFVAPTTPFGIGDRTRTGPLLWRGMWTVGLSLAVAVFVGLLLNLTPIGLTRLTWTVSLAAVTLLTAVAALWQRRRHPRSVSRPGPDGCDIQPPTAGSLSQPLAANGRKAGVVVGYAAGAVVIAGAAVGLAMASVGWQHTPGFAQLSLVPQGAGGSQSAVSGHVALSVRSQYRGAETFHLVLLRGTSMVGTWDFRLDAGQSWERDVTAAAGQRLTARLTTVGEPSGTQSVAVTSS